MDSIEMKEQPIHKIFIANRGEIADRIISTASRMGITTILPVIIEEKNNIPAHKADEIHILKTSAPEDTFLNPQYMVDLAVGHGADAIHPGYGFLSENAEFARLVQAAGLIWVGPSPKTISQMGNKLKACETAKSAGLPVTKTLSGTIDEILENQNQLTFPLLIKAAAGGGGKGMKTAKNASELRSMLPDVTREAQNYFGDPTVFVEEYIENPRHIEVQILGDHQGNLVHLYERECSIQRRYQKIIEEAPSSFVDEKLRERLTNDALNLCKQINYCNTGTVEFLVDADGNHYFLEMNPRLQVEHPVTESITGLDLVEEQIRIAMGFPLPFSQKDIKAKGHAVEARIYAEDALANFSPVPGNINYVKWPEAKKVRTDTFFNSGTEIQSHFDPMLAKITAHAFNRKSAIRKLSEAISQTSILGVTTNLPYLKELLKTEAFISGKITTHFTSLHRQSLNEAIYPNGPQKTQLLLAAYLIWITHYRKPGTGSIWSKLGHKRWGGNFSVKFNVQTYNLKSTNMNSPNSLAWEIDGVDMPGISDIRFIENQISFCLNESRRSIDWYYLINEELLLGVDGYTYKMQPGYVLHCETGKRSNKTVENNNVMAPIPGKITSILADKGTTVKKGKPVLILEAMKMENTLSSPVNGILKNICIQQGDHVKAGQLLAEIEENGMENLKESRE
jgi:acetyl/propionyl-CoA carboxylase alpha subunit